MLRRISWIQVCAQDFPKIHLEDYLLIRLFFSYQWHCWSPQGRQKQCSVSQASGGYIFRRRNPGLFQASDIYFHRGNNFINLLKLISRTHTNLNQGGLEQHDLGRGYFQPR